MLAGKVAVVCGYGDVGKGCAQSLRGQGARVVITEIDPICALQAAMEGYQVTTLEDVVDDGRPLRHRDRQPDDHHRPTHMARMKHNAIVGNIGHFDNEIDMAGLAKTTGIKRVNIKPQVDEWVFPDGHSIDRARRGPAAEPRLRDRSPELRDVEQLHQPGDRADRAVRATPDFYERKVYTLPKHLDEEVARLHLDKLGVKLTQLTEEQADTSACRSDGPYKPDHYRY